MNTDNTAAPVAPPAEASAAVEKAPVIKPSFNAEIDVCTYKGVKGLIKRVINRHSRNPITQNVRLFVRNDTELMLQATDLEQALTISSFGKVKPGGVGACLIEPSLLEGVIGLDVNGDKITLWTAKGKREVRWGDPEEFPKLPEENWDYMLSADSDRFLKAISACGRSVALEKGRYALNGILLEPAKDRIEVCGTDGRRLSHYVVPGKKELRLSAAEVKKRGWSKQDANSVPYQVIVPVTALDFMRAVFSQAVTETAFIGITENRVGFCHGVISYQSLLVEGQFPDYRTVIPKDLDVHLVVEREPLIEAIVEAKKCTSIESQAVKFTGLPDGLEIRSKSTVNGEATITLPLQAVPPPYAIGMDPGYVLNALAGFERRYVQINMRDKETGVVIHDGDPEQHYELIMPIDIDGEPTLGAKPNELEVEKLMKETVYDELTTKRVPISADEVEKRIKERGEEIAAWEEHKKIFPELVRAWEIQSRKIESTRNGDRFIGELLVSPADAITPSNLMGMNSVVKKPRKAPKVTARDLDQPNTVTAVKQGRPDPAAEITIEEQLETPQALGYRLDDGKQWKLW